MQITRSQITAGAIVLVVAGYFAVRSAFGGGAETVAAAPPAAPEAVGNAARVPIVVVTPSRAAPRAQRLALRGETAPERMVVVSATTPGLVVDAPAREGAAIAAGAPLCRLDPDAREAVLAEAQALVRTREIEFDAAKTLVEKGHRSTNQLAAAQASLDAARAQVTQARNDLAKIVLRAPFAGVFNERIAHAGDFLALGEACGAVVDLDPIVIIVPAPERSLAVLKIGEPARIALATGEELIGEVRYISRMANAATRTFDVKIEAPNPGNRIPAGLSAQMWIAGGEALAHFVPRDALTLNTDGAIGLRLVTAEDVVQFAAVSVLEETADGVWVTGLPDRADIITTGQDFVSDGMRVRVERQIAAIPTAQP